MNILITGADGFIGKNLEKRLNEFDKFKVTTFVCISAYTGLIVIIEITKAITSPLI